MNKALLKAVSTSLAVDAKLTKQHLVLTNMDLHTLLRKYEFTSKETIYTETLVLLCMHTAFHSEKELQNN